MQYKTNDTGININEIVHSNFLYLCCSVPKRIKMFLTKEIS